MKLARAASLVLPVVLVAVVTLGLGGCSGDPEPRAQDTASVTPTPVAAATDGVISPKGLPADPVFRNEAQGVIDDVEVESCDTEPGAVTASGTATNSGDFARDVVVVMSWTAGATGDVVAKAVATVEDLAPGESAEWDLKTTVPGSTTTACVPSALAGQLKG